MWLLPHAPTSLPHSIFFCFPLVVICTVGIAFRASLRMVIFSKISSFLSCLLSPYRASSSPLRRPAGKAEWLVQIQISFPVDGQPVIIRGLCLGTLAETGVTDREAPKSCSHSWLLHLFIYFCSFCSSGEGTQGLIQMKLMLCHWAALPALGSWVPSSMKCTCGSLPSASPFLASCGI